MQPTGPDEIKHFLVSLDVASGEVDVQSFETDYDAAQEAYARAERANGCNPGLDIVLLSADSLETIKQTHSSYFNGKSTPQLKELLPRLRLNASPAASASGAHPISHPTRRVRRK